MYFQGKGSLLKKCKDALECYQKTADMKHSEAIYRLGILYKEGNGVKMILLKQLNY